MPTSFSVTKNGRFLLRTWKTCTDEGIALYKSCRFTEAEQLFVESVRRARDETAPNNRLANALNNLAIVYLARAKFQDAFSLLRESLLVTKSEEDSALSSLQRVFALYLRATLNLEQDRAGDARDDLIHALQTLGSEHRFFASPLWERLAVAYMLTGQLVKASDVVDRLLATEPELSNEQDRLYFDDVLGIAVPSAEWLSTVRNGNRSAEATIQALLLRAELHRLTPTRAKADLEEALLLGIELGDHRLIARSLLVSNQIALARKDMVRAAEFCQHALEMARRLYGQDHPVLISYLREAASLSLFAPSSTDSSRLFDQIEQIARKNFGTVHPAYAHYQLLYATFLPYLDPARSNLNSDRKDMARSALQTFLAFFDDGHIDVVGCKATLAQMLVNLGDIQEAKTLANELPLDISSKSLKMHSQIIATIALLLNIEVKAMKSEDPDEELLARLYKSLEGLRHDGTTSAQQLGLNRQKADLLKSLNKRDEAEQLLLDTIKLSEAVDPFICASCVEDLIQLYQESKKFDEALNLVDRAIRSSSADCLRLRARKAKLIQSMGNEQEAIELAMELLMESKQLLPNYSDVFVDSYSLLLAQYLAQERLEEAVRAVGILADMVHAVGPGGTEALAISKRFVADAYSEKRDKRAEALYLQSLSLSEKLEGASPQVLDDCLISLSDFHRMNGQNDLAKHLLERCVALRIKVHGEDSSDCAIAKINLALICADTDLDRAQKLSKCAIEVIENSKTDKEIYRESLRIRAYILEKSNRLVEAQELVRQAEELAEDSPEEP